MNIFKSRHICVNNRYYIFIFYNHIYSPYFDGNTSKWWGGEYLFTWLIFALPINLSTPKIQPDLRHFQIVRIFWNLKKKKNPPFNYYRPPTRFPNLWYFRSLYTGQCRPSSWTATTLTCHVCQKCRPSKPSKRSSVSPLRKSKKDFSH